MKDQELQGSLWYAVIIVVVIMVLVAFRSCGDSTSPAKWKSNCPEGRNCALQPVVS